MACKGILKNVYLNIQMKNLIIFSFLGSLGFYIYKNLKAIANIDTSVIGINLEGGLFNLKLNIKLNVFNPSSYDINFQKIDSGVYINKELIGDIYYDNPIVLPKGANIQLVIPVHLNPLYAATTLINQINSGGLKIEVKGKLKAEDLNTDYYEIYEIA